MWNICVCVYIVCLNEWMLKRIKYIYIYMKFVKTNLVHNTCICTSM